MSIKLKIRSTRPAPPAWPAPPPVPTEPVDRSAGRDGAELRRQTAVLLANRNLMLRIAALPRLSPEQERLAIAQFRTTRGITRCPTAFLVPSQHAGT